MSALRRFLYRATSEGGTRVDLLDNLGAEVERLTALAELLGSAGAPLEAVGGLSELLRDLADRMREILRREVSGEGSVL